MLDEAVLEMTTVLSVQYEGCTKTLPNGPGAWLAGVLSGEYDTVDYQQTDSVHSSACINFLIIGSISLYISKNDDHIDVNINHQ